MTRRNISSGSAWEKTVGYSRAVRVGALVEVAGTTAIDDRGEVVGDIRPAATLVQVASLVRSDLLVEIEATAVVPEDSQ